MELIGSFISLITIQCYGCGLWIQLKHVFNEDNTEVDESKFDTVKRLHWLACDHKCEVSRKIAAPPRTLRE